MPHRLPLTDEFRATHYLNKARREGDCLVLGNGTYRPTWHKEHGHRQERGGTERIANLICRVTHGPAPIDKKQVLHSCDNLGCINPTHLSWGTQSENLRQAVARNRMVVPRSDRAKMAREGKGGARLTPNDILRIRERLDRETLKQIAADFGVSFQTISKVKRGQRWAHV